jgi:hypothetical protein
MDIDKRELQIKDEIKTRNRFISYSAIGLILMCIVILSPQTKEGGVDIFPALIIVGFCLLTIIISGIKLSRLNKHLDEIQLKKKIDKEKDENFSEN